MDWSFFFSRRYRRKIFYGNSWSNWQYYVEVSTKAMFHRVEQQRSETMFYLFKQDVLNSLGKFHPTSI